MATSPYVVCQGDYLLKLAVRYGFDAKSVWELPENQGLRDQRPDPNMLCPGDILYITRESPAARSLSSGQTNTFQATPDTTAINLRFTIEGKPRAGEAYDIDGAGIAPGALDDSGLFTGQISTCVDTFTITFPDNNDSYLIRVGHLHHPNTESGVRQRLALLGLYVDPPSFNDSGPPRYRVDDEGDDANHYTNGDYDAHEASILLQIAVCYFQRKNQLTETGLLDAETVAKLVEVVGK